MRREVQTGPAFASTLGSCAGCEVLATPLPEPLDGCAIASVLIELRLANLAPDLLGEVEPDLLVLLRAYEAELADGKFTDWPGMLAIAVEAAANCSTTMLQLPILLLDVPITSKAELSFVATLCSSASEMLATVPAADTPTLSLLRDGLRFETDNLDNLASAVDGGNDRRGSLARLQRHLFSEDATAAITSPDECVEIARRVLALAREGVAFDRMAVLLRSPEEYRGHLEEAFARAGDRHDDQRVL
jgi:ATP-dependent helicase/nuclease subunit B